MTNSRKKYSPAQEVALTTQVDGLCPLCGKSLFYTKNSKNYKAYEIAHICPLNPTPEEEDLLKDEERLHSDVNHPNNLIPLCKGCHGTFDKPRTVEEYRNLYTIKQSLLARSQQQEIQTQYQLEKDITSVIEGLYSGNLPNSSRDLELDPKSLEKKLDDSMARPTRQKIKHNVQDYFIYIRNELFALERINPNVTNLISSQVRAYYYKQKSLNLSQQDVFVNLVAWLDVKTNPQTLDAAEIVASFYIQNCEVFE